MARPRWLAIAVIGFTITAWMGAVAAQTPPASESPVATSEHISLDLKSVDILDVLKLLSEKSGLNFVAGRNVNGRVTIFVNDVDVWEAFERIISANDLAYERHGTIVTVMLARDYELIYGEKFGERTETFVQPLHYAKGVQVATVLNQVKSGVGRVVVDEATNTIIMTEVPSRLKQMKDLLSQLDRPTKVRVYTLNYAEAEKLKEKVQELLSPIGTFTFDARTNKAIISDLVEVLQKTDQVIHAFDTPDGEVLIDAKIVSVDLTDEMDLGIDWQQVLGGVDMSTRSNFRVLSDIVGGAGTGGALKLLSGDGNIQVIIEALKKLTKTETLSNPHILVSNNQEAKILVGTKEAVVTVTTTVPATGSTVSSPEIQYVDVGTKLFVTPSVKPDGYVQMKIRPEISSAKIETFQTNRIPIVTSTEAETHVLVKSGSTLILGGLIETKHAVNDSRVPILGDIPFLGAAFKGSTTTKKKTELVLFLTPQIILPDGTKSNGPAASGEAGSPIVTLQDPVPAGYRNIVRQRLQAYLISQFMAASLPKGSVTVSFVLSHDGTLMGKEESASPQGEPFIQAARQALMKAQPFPPFPSGSDANEVRFRIAVEYNP